MLNTSGRVVEPMQAADNPSVALRAACVNRDASGFFVWRDETMGLKFILNTAAHDFADVLKKETLTVSYREFPAGRGRLVLQRANSDTEIEPTRVTIDGVFVYATDGGGESGYPAPDVIKFDLLHVSSQPQRIEVEVTSHEQAIGAYYVELLERIATLWSEAQPVILPYLRQVRAQLGIYQPPEPGSAKARGLTDFVTWVVDPGGEPQAELVFRGTPSRCVAIIREVLSELGRSGIIQPGVFNLPFEKEVSPDAHSAHAWWSVPGVPHNGNISITIRPDGTTSRIVPYWDNEHWPKMREPWELLQQALEKQGWLEVQPATTNAPATESILIRGTVQHFVTWLKLFCSELHHKRIAPVLADAVVFEGNAARINLLLDDSEGTQNGVAHILAVSVPDGVRLTVDYDDREWPEWAAWHGRFHDALDADSWTQSSDDGAQQPFNGTEANLRKMEAAVSTPDETFAWGILAEGVKFLFTQVGEFLKERREKRKAKEAGDAPPAKPSAPSAEITKQPIDNADELLEGLRRNVDLSARAMEVKQVESLVRQLREHSETVNRYREKAARPLSVTDQVVVEKNIDDHQTQIAEKSLQLISILERLTGQSIRVEALDEG